MLRLLAAILAASMATVPDPPVAPGRIPRIRAIDQKGAELLHSAFQRSSTVRQLQAAIERSDLIVIVNLSLALPRGTGGNLKLLTATRYARYVLITLDRNRPAGMLIELLGHELQHAVEIAQDTTVTNQNGMERLYQRIGHASSRTRGFDTIAARDVAHQVRQDLERD